MANITIAGKGTATTQAVRMLVDGVDQGSVNTGSSPYAYSFTIDESLVPAASVLGLFLDGATAKAEIVTIATGASMSGLDFTNNYLKLRSDKSGSVLTNADLITNLTYADTDHRYSNSPAGSISVPSGVTLNLLTGHTYTPTTCATSNPAVLVDEGGTALIVGTLDLSVNNIAARFLKTECSGDQPLAL